MFAPGSVPREITSLFSLDGWTDTKALLESEAKKLKPWTFALHSEANEDNVLSAAEAFDPKTDIGCVESVPLKELLAKKTIVPAASLSETEIVDLFDALLIYQSMFMRAEPATNTLFTCAYLHELSLAEGNKAVKAMCRATLKNVDTIIHAVVNAQLREGDEEFIPTTYDLALPEESVEEIVAELDAVLADKATADAFKTRLTLQRSLLAVIDGFVTVHQYTPDHPPAAQVANNEKHAKLEAKRKAAMEEAAAKGTSPQVAAAAAATNADEAPTCDSLPFYTKEELDAFRPKTDVAALLKAFSAAVNAWHRSGNTEPAKTDKAFTKYAPTWMSLVSPSKIADLVPMNNAKQFLKDFASNLTAINQWKNVKAANNWYVLLGCIKAFNATNPGVVARSIGVLFLYNPEVDLILDARSFADVIVHTLDVVHGSSLAKAIYYDFHDTVTALAQAMIEGRKIPGNPKLAAVMLENVKTTIVHQVRDQVSLLARVTFGFVHTMMKSRGACHIGMPAVVSSVAEAWQNMMELEGQFFGVLSARGGAPDPKTSKHFLLTCFASELLSECLDSQFNSEVSLELLSKPEAAAFAIYRYQAATLRLENVGNLFADANSLASAATAGGKGAKNLKNLIEAVGAAHAVRKATAPPVNVVRTFEIVKNSANAAFMVLTALKSVIPKFVQPEHSLTRTGDVFDNRFFRIRQSLPSHFCPRFGELAKMFERLDKDPNATLDQVISLLDHFYNNVVKKHVETPAQQPLPISVAYEKVAKHNLGVLKAAQGLIRAGSLSSASADLPQIFRDYTFDFEYVKGFPQLIQFNLTKKQ